MDVDGPETATFRTIAAPDLFDITFEDIWRNVLGYAQDVSTLMTFLVAVALVTSPDATKKNTGTAIAAFSHRSID
jgi:hypothetical protein